MSVEANVSVTVISEGLVVVAVENLATSSVAIVEANLGASVEVAVMGIRGLPGPPGTAELSDGFVIDGGNF